MATTRGSWQLDESIMAHWRARGLDGAFRRFWLASDRASGRFHVLHDEYSWPEPPGPYCVFHKWEPEVIIRMTGDQGEETQIVRWRFEFRIHARDVAGKSAKEIAAWLAGRVASEFDPHNQINVTGAAHIETIRGPDYDNAEGDDEHAWVLEYEWLLDATITVTPVSVERSSSSHSESFSSGSTSCTCSTSASTEEDDDVLDFADIGGVYDSAAAATANSAAVRTYLASRVNDTVQLKFGGPRDYGTKRQPGAAYLDLSAGTIAINVGGSGKISDIWLQGPSKIYGVNAASDTTPVFTITRTSASSVPQIVLENMVFESDGSGLKVVAGGSGMRLESIKIDDFTGAGTLEYENWDDVDAGTCGYGLWIENADYGVVRNLQIEGGSGHGVVIKRLHAGEFDGRVRSVDGIGYKVQQVHEVAGHWRAESCTGYGMYARDVGVNRRSGGVKVANNGGPNVWEGWLEANNGRGTSATSAGYSFRQFKWENCARIRFTGHHGWRSNQANLDRMSRLRNTVIEELHQDPSVSADMELVTAYQVDGNIVLPADGFGDANITNWDSVWTDQADRPTATIVGSGTANDPERIRITWPAQCFDATSGSTTAYWRPWGNSALASPGAFYFSAQIQDVDGNAAGYCALRESDDSNRQAAWLGSFDIGNVGGAITPFTLWDTNERWLSGEFYIDDTLSSISPEFNAWFSGMQDANGHGIQSTIHTIDILQLRLYKLV